MPFSEKEKQVLLQTKFVGPTVVKRLEEAGFDSFESLKGADVSLICDHIAAELASSCWKNSPQSRKAIENAIEAVKNNYPSE